MYDGVPSTLPACDSLPLPAEPLRTVVIDGFLDRLRRGLVGDAPAGKTLARPQSITCTSPKEPTITFDGFRSRWITPRAWA